MADGSVTLDMSIDEKGLNNAIKKLNDTVKEFVSRTTSGFKEVDSELDELADSAKKLKIEPTTEGLEEAVKNLDRLNATIDNQRYTLESYRKEYKKVVEEHGDGSRQALKLERQMLELESSIDKNIKTSDEYASVIGDLEDKMSEGADTADRLQKKMDETGETSQSANQGMTAFGHTVSELVVSGVEMAVGAIADLLDKTRELRTEMSFLEQNARTAGVSLETTSEAMRNLNAITGETDSNVEAVSNLLAAGFDDNSLQEAVEALSGAVIQFPDTMKIESLADSLQETIATGEATGQFSELLGRLGINVDSYNKKIAHMSEQSRANYSVQLLQREGLAQVNEQWRENNKTLVEAADAEFEYNQTLAELGEILDPLRTQVLQGINEALTENKDVISDIAGFIADFIGVAVDVIGVLAQIPAPIYIIIAVLGIVIKLVTSFGSVFGIAAKGAATGIASAAQALSKAAPAAMKAGTSFGLLALEIMGVVLVIALLVSAIASLVRAFKGVPEEVNIDVNGDIPSMDDLKNQLKSKGYASGTASAASGWAWVGENGPELVNFRGGERVMTANQSSAFRSTAGSERTNYYVTYNNTFKVDDIRTYQQIENKMKNQRITQRMGYIGGQNK